MSGAVPKDDEDQPGRWTTGDGNVVLPREVVLRMVAFLADLAREDFDPGRMVHPPEEGGVMCFSYSDLSPTLLALHDLAYADGWIPDGTFYAFAETPLFDKCFDDHLAVGALGQLECQWFLAWCVRGEHWCEGYLIGAWESGLLVAVLKRLKALVEAGR